jgi:pimeloyl-ACP methyl ester carboxylesterase
MLETRFVITADGRRLAYCIGGDADGFPVFALHGTPGGRLLRRDDIYAPDGVLGISYDRPGYGQSTRHRGRTVADGAGDIAAIADDLGLTTFAVSGVSGGGPHALAAAALLPDRVIRCATMVGIPPYGVASLDYSDRTKGMAALRSAGEAAIEKSMQGFWVGLDAFERGIVSPETSPLVRRLVVDSTRDGLQHGFSGYADDIMALMGPWGFELGAVQVPTRMLVMTNDPDATPAQGSWLAAQIPHARLVIEEGAHIGVPEPAERELTRWAAHG